MIGAKYLWYFQNEVLKLPSGPTVLKSPFKTLEGSCGVDGGPHPVIKQIEVRFRGSDLNHFFSTQMKVFLNGYQVNPGIVMCRYRYQVKELKVTEIQEDNEIEEDNILSICSLEFEAQGVFATSKQKLKRFKEAKILVVKYNTGVSNPIIVVIAKIKHIPH